MKIAITGARGYVGRFVAQALSKEHDVIGLARSNCQVTEDLTRVKWCIGDLEDINYLKSSIEHADLVIHCAMSYTQEGNEDDKLDKQIVDTILAQNKKVIYTSSLFGVKDGRLIVEKTQSSELYWRFQQEERILQAGGDVVRLGFVYGGNAGYFWEIVKPDSDNNVYVTGQRESIWPMIQIYDLANLYLTVVEHGQNQIYHAWDGYQTQY
ncbi:MAG: NAD-dependent epimerase/dehydratase family protein, partial [Kangiellaceae bacterium]|nr:NAD-dependent epimerase/dehydratase family protein [Kangiellaceae bacterium]